MTVREFFSILVACLAGLDAFAQTTPSSVQVSSASSVPRRPNIIFIMSDDLGYGDLSCYGQTKFATPNLDKLAAQGMRFTSFYAGSTVCSPSRAAMMLGKHTGHLNIRGNSANTTLLADEVTVAKLLKDSGYATCLLGKWGLVNDPSQPGVPQKQGFDQFFGYLSNKEAHDYYPERLWRYEPPRADNSGFDGMVEFPENAGDKKGNYLPDQFTKAALNFISNTKQEWYNKYRPFFLYLSYTTPHANNEEFHRSGNGMQVPTDAPYSSEPWPKIEKNKAAMIARMDADIGKILEKLKQTKQEDNTIIFFASDNGPHHEGGVDPKFFKSSGPFQGTKRDLTEGGIRVPLIVRWPERIKPGQVTDFPCAMWDFLPTAAAIARTDAPRDIDGISLLPLLTTGTQTNRHDCLYWEFHERGFQQAVRADDWKAIRPQRGEKLELYNLKSDPGETKNVAKDNPEIVAKMENLMKRERADSDRWPMRPPPEKAEGKKKKSDTK